MLGGETLDAQRLQALPSFAFAEPDAHETWRVVRWPLLALWALTTVLLLLALRRAAHH